ncbi:MAG: hypothetical protein ACXADB_03075 [Candidatus Hermodarchaeia archaeon]|jgi:hypothetical protein
MKALGHIREMYATIAWCGSDVDDPPGIERFADLQPWCEIVNVWRDTMAYGSTNHRFTAFNAVVGLKEREWDEGNV